MTKIPFLAAAALILLTACSSGQQAQDKTSPPVSQAASKAEPQLAAASTADPQASSKAYVCEMGCEVADAPGKCSKCGMTLMEVNRADIVFTCGVCGFKSDKPGACPKDHTILNLVLPEKKA